MSMALNHDWSWALDVGFPCALTAKLPHREEESIGSDNVIPMWPLMSKLPASLQKWKKELEKNRDKLLGGSDGKKDKDKKEVRPLVQCGGLLSRPLRSR